MDIGIFIALMIVMYVVPELLKRFKAKPKYKYPEFPPASPGDVRMPGTLSQGMKPLALSGDKMSGEGMPGDEGHPSWAVRLESAQPGERGVVGERDYPALDTSMAAQGVVWAEILARPVSMRPMRRGTRRI